MSASSCWVGFLRAVNVGGRTVTMEALRGHLEGLDLGTVSTFIASGNVIFEGAAGDEASITERVETALGAALGYQVETFVRSVEEVAALVASPVFRPAEGVAVHVGFLRRRLDRPANTALLRLAGPEDRLEAHGRELWWRREGGIGGSPISGAALARALGQPTTLRTVRTLERIAGRYPR